MKTRLMEEAQLSEPAFLRRAPFPEADKRGTLTTDVSRRRDEDHRYLPTRVMRPDDRRLRDCCDRLCRRDRHIVSIPFHRGLLPAVLVSEHVEERSEALSAPLSIQSGRLKGEANARTKEDREYERGNVPIDRWGLIKMGGIAIRDAVVPHVVDGQQERGMAGG